MKKNIRNMDVHYIQYGNETGNEIVLLHGWGQNIEMMMPLGNELQDYHITILDFPGFGESSSPTSSLTIYDYVEILEELLESIFSYKLSSIFFHKTGINSKAYYKSLTQKEIDSLVNVITKFSLKITGVGSFDKAQVCKGGISLFDINPLTMESKVISKLYITGEILDVNGECGGYNLAFAFITGYKAGESYA